MNEGLTSYIILDNKFISFSTPALMSRLDIFNSMQKLKQTFLQF